MNTQKAEPFYGGILQKLMRRHVYYPLTAERINEILQDTPELNTGRGSSADGNDFLIKFLLSLDPKPVDTIEIGTFMGLGTAVLASLSRSTYTFDIWYRNAHPLWTQLELNDRINSYAGNQKFIDDVIRALRYNPALNINFAFIDGEHKYKNVKHDFNQVKFCGRVLFHDADIPEIGKFITQEIGGEILSEEFVLPIGTFGYWEAK